MPTAQKSVSLSSTILDLKGLGSDLCTRLSASLPFGPFAKAYRLCADEGQELADKRQMRGKKMTKFEERINNVMANAKAASTEVDPIA